jgi:hypothetical protein
MEKFEKINESRIDIPIVEGELVEAEEVRPEFQHEEETIIPGRNKKTRIQVSAPPPVENRTVLQKTYLLLPFLFLTVALLGGWRLAAENNSFVFWRPALFCLMAAAFLMVLFVRARLIQLEAWFSEDFSALKNIANGAVLLTLFAATAQIFNALLPESGLPFWVFAFCFFWTLWNNLFADFDTKKLIRSLGALFGLAFVVKYLILANLTAPAAASWWQGILQNPTREALTWLLDLPRFSAGTGYFQFFTVVFYLFGLYLLPPRPAETRTKMTGRA